MIGVQSRRQKRTGAIQGSQAKVRRRTRSPATVLSSQFGDLTAPGSEGLPVPPRGHSSVRQRSILAIPAQAYQVLIPGTRSASFDSEVALQYRCRRTGRRRTTSGGGNMMCEAGRRRRSAFRNSTRIPGALSCTACTVSGGSAGGSRFLLRVSMVVSKSTVSSACMARTSISLLGGRAPSRSARQATSISFCIMVAWFTRLCPHSSGLFQHVSR